MNTLDALQVGDAVPPWTMADVDPARMRTMAAILRDPYPVHWDRSANTARGYAGRVINQGPLNLGYIVNMLQAWAGRGSVRRLQVSFGRPVLDGETGFLVPHGDVGAMAAAFSRLAASPKLVAMMGAKARAFAETFTWVRAADETEGHLARLIHAGGQSKWR